MKWVLAIILFWVVFIIVSIKWLVPIMTPPVLNAAYDASTLIVLEAE